MSSNTKPLVHANTYGHEEATKYRFFVGAYKLTKTSRGLVVTPSPDGHVTGTCDRCSTAIGNIYVFANEENKTMHVGCDCMHKMGLPLQQVQKASAFWRAFARTLRTQARAKQAEATREERQVAWERQRQANLDANTALVEELQALQASPFASGWERSALEGLVKTIAYGNGERLLNPKAWEGVRLEAIRARIALCASSTLQSPGRKVLTLTVYRNSIAQSTIYGTSFRNFLTDGTNAYTYKGTHNFPYGSTVTATWTVEPEANIYENLTATVLKRPAKIVVEETTEETEFEEDGPSNHIE